MVCMGMDIFVVRGNGSEGEGGVDQCGEMLPIYSIVRKFFLSYISQGRTRTIHHRQGNYYSKEYQLSYRQFGGEKIRLSSMLESLFQE